MNTVRLKMIVANNFYEYLMLKDEIKKNVLIKHIIPPEEKNNIRLLEKEDIDNILNYLQRKELHIRVSFYLLIFAGLRVNEVARLVNEDIQVINRSLVINIRREIAKNNKQRLVPYVDKNTSNILVDYVSSNSSNKVARVSKRTLQYHATQISKKVNVKFTCHSLRHNYATRLLDKDIRIDVIQSALGHKNIETTRRYAATLENRITEVAAKIE